VLWIFIINAFSVLIAIFSYLYWNIGSTENFSIELTRLDAVYFTVGTLSTAGSGNITATSDAARAIQALQMAFDLGLVLFAIGIALNRFSLASAQKRPAGTRSQKRPAGDQGRRSRPLLITAPVLRSYNLFLAQYFIWESFLNSTKRQPDSLSSTAIRWSAVTVTILLIFVAIRLKLTNLELSAYIANAFLVLIASFSYIYWSNGTLANFNMKLTHLDAIYFTLGTLSTAGTGNITAMTETVRGLQTLQMVLGLGLVLFAVGMAMNRLSSASIQELPTQQQKHADRTRGKRSGK